MLLGALYACDVFIARRWTGERALPYLIAGEFLAFAFAFALRCVALRCKGQRALHVRMYVCIMMMAWHGMSS